MADRIRLLRLALGLSQTEFAKRMGMTRSMVSNMELDLVDIPDYKIEMISKVFNASVHWLRTGEGEMFNPVGVSLDALAKANNLDDLTRAVIITLIEMPQQQREAFQTLVSNAAEKMRSTDQEGAQAMNIANALDIIEAAKAQGFEMDLDTRTE